MPSLHATAPKPWFSEKSKNEETCKQGKRAQLAQKEESLEMLACKFKDLMVNKTGSKVTKFCVDLLSWPRSEEFQKVQAV